MIKKIILVLTIIIPMGGIIIFNFYSKSHFDIPVYHQESIPDNYDCGFINIPYTLDLSQYFTTSNKERIYPFLSKEIKIFTFDQSNDHFRAELNKVGDEFLSSSLVRVYDFDLNSVNSSIPISDNITGLQVVNTLEEEIKNCIFLFEDKNDNAVLIDSENRIRGYYDLMDSDLTDSLIVETKILLYQIENGDNHQ